jgi:hypothetical protein
MGNITSKNLYKGGTTTENENTKVLLEDEIDYIATHYILTMNFQSLRNLYKKKYCDDLIILTSEIINKYFKDLQVNKLVDRVENGVTENGVTENGVTENGIVAENGVVPENGVEPKNMVFINKDDMNNVIRLSEQQDNKIEKCNQISSFYIKIAHIFAAIVTTINPEYIHTDSSGRTVKYKLSEKHNIPKTGHVEIFKTNICGERIDILKNDLFLNLMSPDKPPQVNPNPEKLCFFNQDKSLADEPGIPELVDLYYDTDFDFETGKFTGMTPKTATQFQKDLNKFYTEYTGNVTVPENIKKFSDIPLRDYSKKKYCESKTYASRSYEIAEDDELFQAYAKNLKSMVHSVNEKHDELVEILNKIFVFIRDGDDKTITINPELNENSLQNIFIETRDCINDLYMMCEKDFIEGIQIYEAIVETKMFETTQNQISSLEEIGDTLMSYSR